MKLKIYLLLIVVFISIILAVYLLSSDGPGSVPYDVQPKPLNLDFLTVDYPASLQRAGIEGTVYIELYIGTKGEIRELKLMKSPHPELSRFAIEAVRKIEFAPATQRGKEVAAPLIFTVNFQKDKMEKGATYFYLSDIEKKNSDIPYYEKEKKKIKEPYHYAGTECALPELKSQAYVGTQKFSPQRDEEWVKDCLNLNIDQRKFGCEIVAYKIKWLGGKWSSWFIPGVNDLYKKPGEPLRRFWACFNDHSFQIIYIADERIDFGEEQ